jgi:ferredoxin
MTTEYAIDLDRDACEGVFACLVRDDRFVEGADGLARIDADDATASTDDVVVATYDDDRLTDAQQAARACPVDAIEVRESAADANAATEGDDE